MFAADFQFLAAATGKLYAFFLLISMIGEVSFFPGIVCDFPDQFQEFVGIKGFEQIPVRTHACSQFAGHST